MNRVLELAAVALLLPMGSISAPGPAKQDSKQKSKQEVHVDINKDNAYCLYHSLVSYHGIAKGGDLPDFPITMQKNGQNVIEIAIDLSGYTNVSQQRTEKRAATAITVIINAIPGLDAFCEQYDTSKNPKHPTAGVKWRVIFPGEAKKSAPAVK